HAVLQGRHLAVLSVALVDADAVQIAQLLDFDDAAVVEGLDRRRLVLRALLVDQCAVVAAVQFLANGRLVVRALLVGCGAVVRAAQLDDGTVVAMALLDLGDAVGPAAELARLAFVVVAALELLHQAAATGRVLVGLNLVETADLGLTDRTGAANLGRLGVIAEAALRLGGIGAAADLLDQRAVFG